MIAETQKAPEGAYCAPALRRSIFRLRAKDGWIISTLTLKSSLRFLPCPAVKAHDSIRADQSQNASKVDRKIPGNADPLRPGPVTSLFRALVIREAEYRAVKAETARRAVTGKRGEVCQQANKTGRWSWKL